MRDTVSRGLQGTTDGEDDATDHDGPSATHFLAEYEAEYCSEKASDLVDSDNSSLQARTPVAGFGSVDLRKLLGERGTGKQARHYMKSELGI